MDDESRGTPIYGKPPNDELGIERCYFPYDDLWFTFNSFLLTIHLWLFICFDGVWSFFLWFIMTYDDFHCSYVKTMDDLPWFT